LRANALTLDIGASKLSQGCIAQTCLVEIERFDGPAPAVTAHQAPAFASDAEACRRRCGFVVTSGSSPSADGLSRLCSVGIVPRMSDVVSPFPTAWLTYHQVADRLGLRTSGAAAARARRAKWPKRTRNDTLEVEVCVPAEILAAGPSKAWERRPRPDNAGDGAQAMADAVAAAVAPLRSIIETLSDELNAARAVSDALRNQLAAAQAEAAEFKGRSMAIEAALEQAMAERCDLRQQVDHGRREHQAVQERIVQAHAETLDERRRRHATEDLMARLKHELNELQQAGGRRRWWQWR
jgi:hypothetical protein